MIGTKHAHSLQAQLDALDKSQAVIEFDLDGIILHANQNFLNAMGYSLNEIKGKHHRMFVDPAYAESREYQEFWQRLNRGEFQVAEYKRFGKNGKEIWIQASYNPLIGSNGKPFKVVKYATDITAEKLRMADYMGQIAAINTSQAVIHFNLDGTIIDANDNFLQTTGYALSDIKGKHHRMFVDPAYAESTEYKEFWKQLAQGKYQAGEYKRFGKNHQEIWIQASYNPIFDMNGKPFKVVKYATDITEEKLCMADYTGQIAAINKSQAVIHFNMDGTIIDANENFLQTMGYTLGEIQGKHHSMFVDPTYAESAEYKEFWRKLNQGQFDTKTYKRLGKGGKEVWIQASYNPILDMNGKPFKVFKYASDLTVQINAQRKATAAAAQTSMNVQSVATSAEEMTASVTEISKNMSMSKSAVEDIHLKTQAADKATDNLRTAATSMDNVVQLIQKIADQINLLALNATIESARAGEAGRGFAVVASEVKNLANQTTTATDQISKEIKSMQGVSEQVAGSLNGIGNAIASVREFIAGVAGAIEEQSAVTQEISSNMQVAARGVEDISVSLNEMSKEQ